MSRIATQGDLNGCNFLRLRAITWTPFSGTSSYQINQLQAWLIDNCQQLFFTLSSGGCPLNRISIDSNVVYFSDDGFERSDRRQIVVPGSC
jgi:hypothetical protein